MNVAHLAKLLGGDVAGRDRVLCPGPGHTSKDRSLSVAIVGDGYLVHSFAADDWKDCRDHVADLLGIGSSRFPRPSAEELEKLVPDIKKTAELVSEISAACREQDIGSDQINQAIQQLDKVTQQNASASEQMSATSEELAAQAEQLQASIAYFRTDDQARGAAPARTSFRPAAQSKPAAVAAAKPVAAKANGHANGHLNGHAKAPARKAANGRGFALDMTSGGADARDAEFERV